MLKIDQEWPWFVRGFYASTVQPPKTPGATAFETKHKTEVSHDIEIQAARSREDIGIIESGPRYINE